MNFDVFATRLKTLRSSRRLTHQQVGDAVGYSFKTIGNLENGWQPPSLNLVLLLAIFFDVSIDYLVGRKDNHNVCHSAGDNVSSRRYDEIKNLELTYGKALNLDVFAPRLRELRLARRLTLRSVGDAVGCHMKTIGNMENARKAPSIGVMLALADFFGVSVDYLVGWTDYKPDEDDSGEETVSPTPSPDEERKKLIGLIENMREENIDKALSYIVFLGSGQQSKNKKE